MKMWTVILVLILSGKIINAQEKQLIIQVPTLNERNICSIKKQLCCVEGIHFSGYVKDASCLLLRYDCRLITDARIITALIHHLNKKMKYKVIEGYTAFEIIDGKLKEPLLCSADK